MSTGTAPPSPAEALETIEALAGLLADLDAAELPAAALAGHLAGMERIDAVLSVARGQHLAAFDAKDGHLADGQRSPSSHFVPMTESRRWYRLAAGEARYRTVARRGEYARFIRLFLVSPRRSVPHGFFSSPGAAEAELSFQKARSGG